MRTPFTCVLLQAVILAGQSPAAPTPPFPVELLTPAQRFSRTAAGDSQGPQLSGDGRFVAFQSDAPNLVTNTPPEPRLGVFLHDRSTRTTRLASLTPSGHAAAGASRLADVSRDGTWLLFVSDAPDLVPGDSNDTDDIFLRDVPGGRTLLVSAAASGGTGDGESRNASLTPDGRFVVFESDATNLVPDDTNGVSDVFQYEVGTGTLRRVSTPSTDPEIARRPTGPSASPVISDDGSTIAFRSEALNLAPSVRAGAAWLTNNLYVRRGAEPTNRMVNPFADVLLPLPPRLVLDNRGYQLSADGRFLLTTLASSAPDRLGDGLYHVDLDTGERRRLDAGPGWTAGADDADGPMPALHRDGRMVVWEAYSDQTTDTRRRRAVFRASLNTGEITRISTAGWITNAAGEWVEGDEGQLLAASPDLEFVAMVGGTTNDPPGLADTQIVIRHLPSGATRRVSRTLAGGPASAFLSLASISDNGRQLVFQALDADLARDDLNHAWDVFHYEWDADSLELVSARHPDRPSRTGFGYLSLGPQPTSADSRYVAFISSRSDLYPGDAPPEAFDVFRLDRRTGSNLLISVSHAGGRGGDGPSTQPVLSDDGRFAAFVSFASNLVPGDTNRASDVFLRDMEAGLTHLASRMPDGSAPPGTSDDPSLSANGQWLVFLSSAPLSPLDRNGTRRDVYLFDRVTRSVTLVSVNAAGTAAGTGESRDPVISPDGEWVVFASQARDLVQPGTASGWSMYRWNRRTGRPQLLQAPGTAPMAGPLGFTGPARFSPDSLFAAIPQAAPDGRDQMLHLHEFSTGRSELIGGPAWVGTVSLQGTRVAYRTRSATPTQPDQIVVVDRVRQTRTLITQGHDGTEANGTSRSPVLSRDGRRLVFLSDASNLVPDDTNGFADVFIRDLDNGHLRRLGGNRPVPSANLLPDEHSLLLRTTASDLVEGDYNGDMDLLLVTLDPLPPVLRIRELRVAPSGELELRWLPTGAASYTVQTSPNLGAPWTEVAARVEPGTDQVVAWIPRSPAAPQGYYRLLAH